MTTNQYDVVIAGGGPGGLSAALALGRARRRVLLCDAGPRRNAAATHMHNFLTRDGTPPAELRRIGREQLATYPNVTVRDACVDSITGTAGAFDLVIANEPVTAKRILLATGMIDERLPIPGFNELWGTSIFQCPYCHGWEIADKKWGILALPQSVGHIVPFALQALCWTKDLTVYTNGAVIIPDEARPRLAAAGIRIETTPIAGLAARDGALASIELTTGTHVACDALFTHPPQRHVDLVRNLGVELDEIGYVKVDPMSRETSIKGIYASGDLSTRMQGALLAAAAGTQTAAMLNVDLAMS